METNELTPFGKALKTFETRGLNGQEQKLESLKGRAADLLAEIETIPCPQGTEAGRLVAVAKTNLEQTVMWAVKALSRNH